MTSRSRSNERKKGPDRYRGRSRDKYPAMPLIEGEFVPNGYCRYFMQGKECPFMKDKGACSYKHEKPPAERPSPGRRAAAPAEAQDPLRSSNESAAPARASPGNANSPRGQDADEF